MANITVKDSSRTQLDVKTQTANFINMGTSLASPTYATRNVLTFDDVVAEPKAFIVFPLTGVNATHAHSTSTGKQVYQPLRIELTANGKLHCSYLYAGTSQYAAAYASLTKENLATYSYDAKNKQLKVRTVASQYTAPGPFMRSGQASPQYKLVYFY